MSGKLTKAEILWTRKCPLKCGYCAMIDYAFEQAPTELMIEGARRLRAQGCEFFAIYGSSPLWRDEFRGLPEFVRAAEDMGILTTVIVDGVEKRTKERIDELYAAGMRSLTCSYDGGDEAAGDKHSSLKSGIGLELVRWYADKYKGTIRDVELVATVTRRNWEQLLDVVPRLSEEGIWFSFDFLHIDRGHPGTKCKGQSEGLRFENNATGRSEVSMFARELLLMQATGARIHQSAEYLQEVVASPEMVTANTWKCHTAKQFPSWVTIDADGSVLPCDDFWTDRSLKVWEVDDARMAAFETLYRAEIESKCKGCAWSTHWDAVRIANTGVGFDHYVHRS